MLILDSNSIPPHVLYKMTWFFVKITWSFGQHTELIIIIVVGLNYIFVISNKSALKYLLKSTYIMLKNK